MSQVAGAADEIRSWPELRSYLEANHDEVRTFGDDLLRFTYRRDADEIAFGGYHRLTKAGSSWVVLAVKLCPRDELRPRPALIASLDLPIGGIAILFEEAILRQSLPLAGLLPDMLEQTLRVLARLGKQLREARGLGDDEDGEDDGGDSYNDSPYAYIYR